jgi:hypothetical protein
MTLEAGTKLGPYEDVGAIGAGGAAGLLSRHGGGKELPAGKGESRGRGVRSHHGARHRLAYFSYETGRLEVFLVPFPGPGGKYQISQAGDWAVRWAAGDKLFF